MFHIFMFRKHKKLKQEGSSISQRCLLSVWHAVSPIKYKLIIKKNNNMKTHIETGVLFLAGFLNFIMIKTCNCDNWKHSTLNMNKQAIVKDIEAI